MSYETIQERSIQIRNETQAKGNSKTRIADQFDDINETKADKLDVKSTSQIIEIVNNVVKPIKSVVVSGNFENEENRNFSKANWFNTVNNEYLNNLGITKINREDVNENQVEIYWYFNNDLTTPTNGLAKIFEENNGKFVRFTWYVYSKQDIQLANLTAGRLGVVLRADNVNHSIIGSNTSNGSVTFSRVAPQVFKVDKTIKFEYTGTLNFIYIATVLEAAQYPDGFANGDFGATGLKIAFANTPEELNNDEIEGDWIVNQSVEEIVEEKLTESKENSIYNNLDKNIALLSPFFNDYEVKKTDINKQLTVYIAGNSIVGFSEQTSSISDTPGLSSGSYPPNMAKQTIPYRILQLLQYPDSDVSYYNYNNSSISKTGTWTNALVGDDKIDLTFTTETNATVQLTFTNAEFCKFIWSCYIGGSKGQVIKFSVSVDGGAFVTPESIGLECSNGVIASDGTFTIPNVSYKFGNVVFRGFDKTKSYEFKVEKISDSGTLKIFGFETWSKDRINVVVTAEGGNTAFDQFNNQYRFGNTMDNPSLVVYEMPYLNDLMGYVPEFKGIADPETIPATPTLKDFYYSSVDGEYPNFSNLSLKAGEYTEYDGSSWVKGSSRLIEVLQNYSYYNDEVLKNINIPVLVLITHDPLTLNKRPFMYEQGLSVLRYLIPKNNKAGLDINYYQKLKGLDSVTSGITTDGLHLNNLGISMYMFVISQIFNIPYSQRVLRL